jgi:hypothetical protein
MTQPRFETPSRPGLVRPSAPSSFADHDPHGRAKAQAQILAKLHRDIMPIDIT